MKKEEFSCKRDELTIRGHIWGRGARPKPAVILSHGFVANEETCHTYAMLLADIGYIAVTFDFCGGGPISCSDGRTQDMTVFTEKEDLLAVIAYVKQQPYVNTENISLLGCSQGGLVAAMVAKELRSEISKLILFYPAFCIPDAARRGHMISFKFDPQNIPDILGDNPMRLGRDYARSVINMNAFAETSGYDGRTLLLHGTEDKIVDISYARRAKDLYPNCQYREIVGAGHVFRGDHDKEACHILRQFMTTDYI